MWAGPCLLVQPLGGLHHANIVHVGGDVVLRPPAAARPQPRLQQVLPGILLHLEGEEQEEVRAGLLLTNQKSPGRNYSFGRAPQRATV